MTLSGNPRDLQKGVLPERGPCHPACSNQEAVVNRPLLLQVANSLARPPPITSPTYGLFQINYGGVVSRFIAQNLVYDTDKLLKTSHCIELASRRRWRTEGAPKFRLKQSKQPFQLFAVLQGIEIQLQLQITL